ncbi:MAG: hypothetical protein KatS3mg118_0554 [Paracoccaceae bacterium]|nr:MAG: hypothetical protein D6686_12125 [Alphaproteobacteria bacterium]GIX12595.1 MAG: hypothetical protein KatS3mg118_0554 [Paracoccaceae bacterium]
MQDTDSGEETILLVTVEETTWLAMGESHLQAMLTGEGDYPRPIVCVTFRDMAHLTAHVPQGVAGLWAVHPAIVRRLRENGEIVDRVID